MVASVGSIESASQEDPVAIMRREDDQGEVDTSTGEVDARRLGSSESWRLKHADEGATRSRTGAG